MFLLDYTASHPEESYRHTHRQVTFKSPFWQYVFVP